MQIVNLPINNSEAVNLTNCDREPIHVPSSIQPHGVLLLLSEPDVKITQVSKNAFDILGITPADLMDRRLGEFISSEHIEAISNCLDRSFEHINPIPLSFYTPEDFTPLSFNGIVHRAITGEIVLELEPIVPTIKNDFFHFYHQIKNTLTKMQTALNLTELCNLIVQEIQTITGFDRVMIYRFNENGDGTVIAEAKQDDQEAFLGMYFPDTDIPKQAKHLYTLNWLRLIPDVNYQAIGLATHQDEDSEELPRLDMSYCSLRSVSPIHIEYLKNMEVAASMSVSLIQNQQLWGLISCHHNTPKFIPYEIRTICEFLGQLMSTEIANKEANENLDYKLYLKTLQGQFVERLARTDDFSKELIADSESLLKLTGAAGVAVCQSNVDITLIGQTPELEQIKTLLPWLLDHYNQDLFVTDSLSSVYPPAKEYTAIASGLLAMAISKIQHRYIIWFRPEMLQTVNWAGNPDKPKRLEEDGTITIFPRQSFESWQETVHGKSSPWLDCEIAGSLELRQAIVDIVLRQAEDLANINLELERSNSELDSFAYIASHDLKEPLRGIHNYATFLLEDYSDMLQGDGAEKLSTLVRLTKRMESLIDSLLKFSRLGRQELQMYPIALEQLLKTVTELFSINPQWENCQIRVPQSLPKVLGDRVLLEEVFINLISNAFKYNDQADKWVEIGWIESNAQEPNFVTICVRDNGIGIREKHLDSVFRIFKRLHAPSKYGGGTGAGLTIVKKIIERHGGNIQVQSVYGQGTVFLFTLPIESNTPVTPEIATDDITSNSHP